MARRFVALLLSFFAVSGWAADSSLTRQYCRTAFDADFEGQGRAALESYLAALASHYGARVAANVRKVSLTIVKGTPKPSFAGVTAGEVACNSGDRYRITLYRDALAGRPLTTAYNTVAHEFQHVVQIERDHLPCNAKRSRDLPRYEREAAAVADQLVPPCR